MGAHSTYNAEISDQILARMALGEVLTAICKEPGMPPRGTFALWADTHFPDRYAQARALQAHALAETAYLTGTRDKTGDAQADRLAYDAGKWLAGKVAPRDYGDKVDHTVSGADGGPVVFKWQD